MQDFRAEIGQLGCFLKVELAHRRGVFHDARVVVVHAVDIRPYLDFLGSYRRADEAGGIVGAAALQVVDFALAVARDEALREIDFVARLLFENVFKMLFDVVQVGFAVFIDHHVVERGNERGFDALFLQVSDDHVGAHQFALREDFFFKLGRIVAAHHREQVVERAEQELHCALRKLGLGVEVAHVLFVDVAQAVDANVCRLAVVLFKI